MWFIVCKLYLKIASPLRVNRKPPQDFPASSTDFLKSQQSPARKTFYRELITWHGE